MDNIQNQIQQKRDSSIELFRIISMICIVAHHYIVNSGVMLQIRPENIMTKNALFALLYGWGGKTGINCFILITGYFMCTSRITVKKFLKLFLQIEFYKIVIYLCFLISGYIPFTLSSMLNSVLPLSLVIYSIGAGFTGSYLVFFLFIPYLNLLIHAMNEKQHKLLILLCLLVGSVFQTFLKAPAAFTYVGWFMVLYLIASFIRLYPKKYFENRKVWGYAAILTLLTSWLSIMVAAFRYQTNRNPAFYYFVSDSNKILAVLTAVSAFLFFKNLKLKYHPVINTVAASTFGVLLIHANSDTMRQWLWKDTLKNAVVFHSYSFIVHAIISVVSVYAICTVIDIIRIQIIERPLFKWIDKWLSKRANHPAN
jgi:Uncharacterized protein conserved in bacteria